MINELVNFYQIGRTFGLKSKEINKVFSHQSKEFKGVIYVSLFIFIIILIIFVLVLTMRFIHLGINPIENTYPSGTKYSTVKIKDFKKKIKLFSVLKKLM